MTFTQTALLLLVLCVAAAPQTLTEQKFQIATEAEVLLDLTASAPGASWLEKGREAATATIYLDRRYHQDVILFNGARQHTYQLLLGRLQPGEHSYRVELNRQQSAPQATTIEIKDAKIITIERNQPEFLALAYAPILYARPNTIGKFSDVPLLAYYETERKGDRTLLRYTVIFSNEDGGTQTSALMARWGRTTDIEYVCETELDAQGHAIKTIFQGVNHKDTEFGGQREAGHPLFLTASDNNNFSDQGESAMRFALRPLPFDLSKASRESVMDAQPWTYRVMADEMRREGKLTSARTLGLRIADFRNYLFIDANSTLRNGALLSFAVKLKGDPKWYPSDLGIGYYKLDRSGYIRTAIRLPQTIQPQQIERLMARCDLPGNPRSREEIEKATAAVCELHSINKVLVLDEATQPHALNNCFGAATLAFGEAAELKTGCVGK
ncbi:MAG: hypothetical protein HYR56_13885 [Acidobacteria bacterium]|nr:hypothetical protein [Acidobacteriota bacterium]MBI3425273.1 hypothetical protein [Acidobacteriota bacterium]